MGENKRERRRWRCKEREGDKNRVGELPQMAAILCLLLTACICPWTLCISGCKRVQ